MKNAQTEKEIIKAALIKLDAILIDKTLTDQEFDAALNKKGDLLDRLRLVDGTKELIMAELTKLDAILNDKNLTCDEQTPALRKKEKLRARMDEIVLEEKTKKHVHVW